MKRLLVYTENYVPGGGNRYLVDLVNGIGEWFDEVLLSGNPGALFPQDFGRVERKSPFLAIPLATKGRLFRFLKDPPTKVRIAISLLFVPAEPLLLLYHLLLSFRLLKRVRPSFVLCCNGGYPAASTVLCMVVAARILRVPVVLSVVSMPVPRRLEPLPLEKWADQAVFRAASVVVVNASAIARSLHDLRGMPIEKARVVHNGLEDDGLPERSDAPGGEPRTIGCVSRWDRGKGGEYLVDAFSLLAHRYPDLRLLMVGKGNSSGELRARVSGHGLDGRVAMTGYYPGDVKGLLAGIDVFAFPSLHEGFPYSILEAMRAGCAVVATDVGGIREAIDDGTDGLLVPPRSAEAIAGAVERLIRNDSLRRRLGKNARSRFLREFRIESMRDNVRSVLRPLVQ